MTKICSRCKQNKQLDDFNKSSEGVLGRNAFCRECCSKANRERYLRKTEEIKAQTAAYKKTPKSKAFVKSDGYKEYQREFAKNRRRVNSNTKLAERLRGSAKRFFQDEPKSGSGVEDLGCSIDNLRILFEKLFNNNKPHRDTGEYMDWSNQGGKRGWCIDHIIPLKYFKLKNREEFLIASNYKNLQPLWRYDNNIKKDKLPLNYKELYNEIRNDLIKAGKISPASLSPL